MHTFHQKRAVTSIKAGLVLLFAHLLGSCLYADVISFTGNLQTDATVLPPFDSPTAADYAQWAGVVRDFHVDSTSSMKAVTFSYGGGTNGNGMLIAPNSFEPYLSLFDAGGDFIASTFFGTTCPAGAQTNPDTGFCFDVALDFPAVPANKRFVVEYVNGTVFVQGSDFVDAVLNVPSAKPSGTFPTIILSTHLESNIPNLYYVYAISMPVVLYYEGGQIPTAVIARDSNSVAPTVDITLSGYLVDLTQ